MRTATRRNLMRFIGSVAAIVTACVSTTPEIDRVRVTNNPEVVRGCKFLGNVHTDRFWRSGSKDSENAFKKEVSTLGGNVGYVVTTSTASAMLGSVGYSGEAYLCETPTSATTPSAGR